MSRKADNNTLIDNLDGYAPAGCERDKNKKYTQTPDKRFDCLYGAAITIGNFDGLHLGHMRLISQLTRRASELGIPAIVYTFRDHPKNALAGAKNIELLTDGKKKRGLLSQTAVDGLYFECFDSSFAALSPGEFIRRILIGKFGAKLVAVGSNFRFGSRGLGDAAELKKFGSMYGFEVDVVQPEPIRHSAFGTCNAATATSAPNVDRTIDAAGGDVGISSSCIRGLIKSGHIEAANRLLGRAHSVRCRIGGVNTPANASGAMELALTPDAGLSMPGTGNYSAFIKICGDMYKCCAHIGAHNGVHDGVYISAHNGAHNGAHINARGSITATISNNSGQLRNMYANSLPLRGGDLHGAEIEIFFYK